MFEQIILKNPVQDSYLDGIKVHNENSRQVYDEKRIRSFFRREKWINYR